MENGTVLSGPRALELNAAVSQQIPRDISEEDAAYWIDNKNELGIMLRKLMIRSGAAVDIRQVWSKFYRKYFGIKVDFSDVVIPENTGGFDRVIFIPKGLTFAVVVKALRKKFKVYLYTENLDQEVVDNVRVADRNYAIRIRERQEADEELKSLSANQLKTRGDNVITLLERLVYELKYYDETGQHLDVQNWTLCAGSRHSDGRVPYVRWRSPDDGLQVHWGPPDDADAHLRGRVAVS